MGAELWLNLVQFLVGIQGQFQFQPALRPLHGHPVFVTQFHAVSVSGGRGRLKEKWPALGWTAFLSKDIFDIWTQNKSQEEG